MHKANRLLLACSMLFCGFSTVSWGQSQHDFDGDGTPDTVESIPGFHPDNPIVGVVRVRSGVDGAVLLEVHGPQANDAFGLAAEAIGDFDGDGVPDIAVAAPRAFLTSDRVGRVYIHSGADGRVLRTLVGRRGDRLGFDVRVMRDLNLDGTPDLTVYGMALDTRGFPVDRTFVYSGVTGELLFDQTYPIRGLTEALVEPIEAWGDLNGTLSLDNGDLVEMLGLIGDGAGPESGGDLNRDDAVDMADFLTLVDALAAGEPPVAETDYVLEQWEWDSLRSTMDAWTWLYPEDAISATTDPEGWRGQQGSHAWWVQGRLRSDGKRLVSGWLETPGELAVGRQGQRASSVGGGGGIGGGPPCAACVTIVQCPESVRLGEDFTVCAQTCNICHGPLEWRVWEGVFEALPPPPGDCVDWVVDFVEMLPIDAVFTVYCYNYNSNGDLICTRTDSCTVIVEDCILELEGCPVELREGESGTLTAIPDPEGGVYTWSILEGGEFLEFFGSVGNTATFEVKDGISCHPPPVDVTIKVRYEKDGCIKEKVCTFEVVIDCDDDGLDDRDESEPGSGNCPYWGIWDSDGDCVSDGDEVSIWGTDPCNPDSDGDGVPDGVEIKLLLLGADYWHPMVYNAEPWHDTDHDGLTDLQEVGSPCNSTPLTHPLLWDTDSDGIWDGCEVANGWDPNNPNSPTPGGDNFDYDNDGLPDAQELCTGCTDPTNPDTDGDGLLDGDESYYFTNTSPCDPDRDNDGLLDGEEINVYGTDPANDDTDGDGMPDGWEVAHGFDPLDPNDGALDADGDGLSNVEEYRWGTDPGNRDSDGDGVEDGEEVAQGSDPAAAESSAPGDGVPVRLSISNPGGHAKWTLRVGGKRTPAFEDYGQAPAPVTYYFAPGKTYTITVSYGGDNLETCPSTRDYSYCASVSVLEGHDYILVDENEADPNGNYCQQQTNLLGCKNGSGVPCNPAAGKSAKLHLPTVEFLPDPDTHADEIETGAVTVLPADIETMTVKVRGVPAETTITASVQAPVVAQLWVDETLQSTHETTDQTFTLDIAGLSTGQAGITVNIGSQQNYAFPVHVGGHLSLSYNKAPTFTPPYRDPDANSGSARGPIPQEVFQAAAALPEQKCRAAITIVDALGHPKPNKAFIVVPRDDYTFVTSGLQVLHYTGENGTGIVGLETDNARLPDFGSLVQSTETPVLLNNIAILTGRSAELFDWNDPDVLITLREEQLFGAHTFTGNRLEFEGQLGSDGTLGYRGGLAVGFPVINKIHLAILDTHLRQRRYAPSGWVDFALNDLLLWDPGANDYFFVTPAAEEHILAGTSYSLFYDPWVSSYVIPTLQSDLMALHEGRFDQYTFYIRPVDDDADEGTTLLDVAAIAAEFGLAFIPGWDLIDVVRYGLLRNIDEDGPATENYVIAAVSLFGLLADAGYLAGPTGLATNAITAAMKVIAKRIPPSAVKAVFKTADSFRASAQLLVEYLQKFPRPQGFSWTNVGQVKDWAVGMAAGVINQWNRILHSPLKLGPDDLANSIKAIHRNTTEQMLSDAGAEGVAALLKHGPGEAVVDGLADALRSGAGGAGKLADESLDSVSSAACKTYRRAPNGNGVPDPKDLQRVDEAIAAAQRQLHQGYRSTVESFVGPDHAIKSMQEFEALRFMRAEDLTGPQVTALNTIRAALGMPQQGTKVTKILPLNQGVAKVADGDPNLSGFFARSSDVFDANTTSKLIDRLRLDRPGTDFLPNSPHVVVETNVNGAIQSNARIPRSSTYSNGSSDEFIQNLDYPYTGNGFPGSRDGHLLPEYTTAATAMDAGVDAVGQPNTVMRFRFDDGTPYPQTINGQTASDWMLIVDPDNPELRRWSPLP